MTDINASLRDILNTQGKGFSTMLAGIQMGVGKIEASLQRGRERRQQLELIDYQYDKQIEKYKETVALQRDADREQREELKTLEVEKARIAAIGKVQEKLIETEGKVQEEREKKLAKDIGDTNTKISEVIKPAVEYGFISTPPRVVPIFNETTNRTEIKIYDLFRNKPFDTPEEYIATVSPFIQFASFLKTQNVKIEDLEQYGSTQTKGDETITEVGRVEFTKDLGRLQNAKTPEEAFKIVNEYQTGKKVFKFNTTSKVPGATEESKLQKALIASSSRFPTMWSLSGQPGMAPRLNLSSVKLLQQEVLTKYSKASDQEKKEELVNQLNEISKYSYNLEMALNEYISANPSLAAKRDILEFDNTKSTLSFIDPLADTGANEDASLLGG